MNFLQNKAVWQNLTLLSYFGLFGLLILWTVILAPPQQFSIALILLFYVGPLLLPLRGLLYGRTSTYTWLSVLVLFYFVAGVFILAGGDDQSSFLAVLEIVLSVFLFVSALAYVRCQKYTTEQ